MAEDLSTGEPEWMQLAWQLADDIRARRRAAGLSQPRLAARIGYTKQYVSLAEQYVSLAERPQRGLPSASLIQAIDDALGADGTLVALHDQAETARRACRPGAQPRTMTTDTATTDTATAEVTTDAREPDTSSTDSDREVENAKRRDLISSAAAITFGAALDEPVARILAAADEPRVPARVRAGDVTHLREAVAVLEAEDYRLGGGPVRHQALAALRWATALMESSCTPEVRRDLAATTADLAEITSFATFDAGHYEPARQLALIGLHAAHESGDLGIRACVACGLARQEIHAGNWAQGLAVLQLALTAGEALTPNGVANLHTIKALAYARKHDTTECLRYLNAATDTYQSDAVSTGPRWLSFFTHTHLEGLLAKARYDLLLGGADVGDRTPYQLALIDQLSAAYRRYPAGRNRAKALTATRLTTLLYREGKHRLAHQMAEETITLAGQIRSARLADDLRVLLRTVPAGGKADEHTRDLRRRLSLVLTEMN